MASIKQILNTHLKSFLDDHQGALLRQKELSEATLPLLRAVLRSYRENRGVLSPVDVMKQNEEINEAISFLCNHNFLFFLVLSNRFDLIREYFKDTALFAQERALVQLIQHERTHSHRHHAHSHTPNLKQVTPQSASGIFDVNWGEMAHGLTNMNLYCYYDMEIKRLTYQHNIVQSRLYSTIADSRIRSLQRIIRSVHDDDEFDLVLKAAFLREAEALHTKLLDSRLAMRTDLDKINVHDVRTADNELFAAKAHFDATADIGIFLKKYAPINAKIQEAYSQYEVESEEFEREFEANEQQFTSQLEQLLPHLNSARQATLDDMNKYLDLIILNMDKFPAGLLEPAQLRQFDIAFSQLKKYKEELQLADNYEATQELVVKCSAELEKIQLIINPVLPMDMKQQFDQYVGLFHKIIIAPQASQQAYEPSGLDGEVVLADFGLGAGSSVEANEPLAQPIRPKVIPSAPDISLMDKDDKSPIVESHEEAMPQPPAIAIVEQVKIAAPSDLAASAVSSDAVIQAPVQSPVVVQGLFKSSMQEIRGVDVNQQLVKEALKQIWCDLNAISENANVTPDDLIKIKEALALSIEIKEHDRYQDISPDAVDLLYNYLDDLDTRYDVLAISKDKLDPVIDLLANLPQLSAKN